MRNLLLVKSVIFALVLFCLLGCSDDDPITSSNNVGSSLPTFTDIDGNVYHAVKIGTQTWMQENLKTTRFKNGSYLKSNLSDTAWQVNVTGACADYNNDPPISTVFGKLYNWYAVTNPLGLCPSGWHSPSDAEWTTLINYLGGDSIAGAKLKEVGLSHWSSPNVGATDSVGFKGLPGGYRLSLGGYFNIYALGFWWSATQDSLTGAYLRTLSATNERIDRYNYKETYGFSVKCIKD
ncbi:MAG: fibrobacter succinogenes major paralogous domain-containing protein [Bacteroidota bacterium]